MRGAEPATSSTISVFTSQSAGCSSSDHPRKEKMHLWKIPLNSPLLRTRTGQETSLE